MALEGSLQKDFVNFSKCSSKVPVILHTAYGRALWKWYSKTKFLKTGKKFGKQVNKTAVFSHYKVRVSTTDARKDDAEWQAQRTGNNSTIGWTG